MSFAVQPPGAGPAAPGATSGPVAARRPAAQPAASYVRDMAPSPAATVQADVVRAARRYEELRQMGRELHFRVEGSHVVVDVCTLDGTIVRTVPPSEGMAIVSGAPPDGASRR